MDLRKHGEPFEKKYIQFSNEKIIEIANTLHSWQESKADSKYNNIAGYCYSATKEDVVANDYSLVPSKYIEFKNHDEDIDFDEKMIQIFNDFTSLLQQEEESKNELLSVFKELGYEIKL